MWASIPSATAVRSTWSSMKLRPWRKLEHELLQLFLPPYPMFPLWRIIEIRFAIKNIVIYLMISRAAVEQLYNICFCLSRNYYGVVFG